MAVKLQYGAGLGLSELVRLRVQDVDLERGTVTVRAGKGDKDRMTVLPLSLRDELVAQVERARVLWSRKGLRPTRFGCEPGFICLVHWRGSSGGRRRLSSGFGCSQPDRFQWTRLRGAPPGKARQREATLGDPGYAELHRGKPSYAELRRGKPGVRDYPASSSAWESL